jgi:deaminated glutathione amidase
MHPRWIFMLPLLLGCIGTSRADGVTTASGTLRIAVVQTALATSFDDNRDRIVAGIASAGAAGARVAVFPEAALAGRGSTRATVDGAVAAIRRAAEEHRIYVIFGGYTHSEQLNKGANWMLAIGPDGSDVFRYDKLYDHRRSTMPGVFEIDGVPCSAIICADRWLRGVEEIPVQQGARISFELSCNFAVEWIDPLQWYWYVPRALRNNVWVVFANTGNPAPGFASSADSPRLRHGHSAIISPDGRLVAAAGETAAILVSDIDTGRATRAEALARSSHPVLRPFWDAGLRLQRGESVPAPALAQLESPETEVTVAVSQTAGDVQAVLARIREARAMNADVVVFPARAVPASSIAVIGKAARENEITVVVGAEYSEGTGKPPGGQAGRVLKNSAFVLGADGALLTRYDQLSAVAPFEPGSNPAAMWFRVKGVPAVVTIGRDSLWTELPELAAAAGALLHLHLDHDPADSAEAQLRRLQVWSNLATYLTFTATANVVGSAIWDDLRGREEIRAELDGAPRPDSGPVEVYSPWSANLVVQARESAQLITATRRVSGVNRHFPRQTANFNPQMEPWYRIGAALIHPEGSSHR